jgi:hypothetical protein
MREQAERAPAANPRPGRRERPRTEGRSRKPWGSRLSQRFLGYRAASRKPPEPPPRLRRKPRPFGRGTHKPQEPWRSDRREKEGPGPDRPKFVLRPRAQRNSGAGEAGIQGATNQALGRGRAATESKPLQRSFGPSSPRSPDSRSRTWDRRERRRKSRGHRPRRPIEEERSERRVATKGREERACAAAF